jgi:AcrR family transcriptional regulator
VSAKVQPEADGQGKRKTIRGQRRREDLLSAAARLFRERGFQATSIDDIGAAAGVSGPALYRHFASKHALLADLVEQSLERERQSVAEAIKDSGSQQELLVRLVDDAVEMQIESGGQITTAYAQEFQHLAPEDQERLVRMNRILITEWTHLLSDLRPDLTEDEVRVVVLVVRGMFASLAFIRTSMDRSTLRELITQMCRAALGVEGLDRQRQETAAH